MSTSAEIAIMHGEKCKSIYLHSDGGLDNAGKVLCNYYDGTTAQFLVAQGDCSVLGKTIGEKIDFDSRLEFDQDGVATQCRFYRRDREETDTEFRVAFGLDELLSTTSAQYVYLIRNGIWYVSVDKSAFQELKNLVVQK